MALRASVLGALALERPVDAATTVAPIAMAHAAWKVVAAC